MFRIGVVDVLYQKTVSWYEFTGLNLVWQIECSLICAAVAYPIIISLNFFGLRVIVYIYECGLEFGHFWASNCITLCCQLGYLVANSLWLFHSNILLCVNFSNAGNLEQWKGSRMFAVLPYWWFIVSEVAIISTAGYKYDGFKDWCIIYTWWQF